MVSFRMLENAFEESVASSRSEGIRNRDRGDIGDRRHGCGSYLSRSIDF